LKNFTDLEACYQRDVDFRVITQITNSPIAIIAPHGGKIESGTSEVARAIAGDDFNFYIFEGKLATKNFASLHLTSRQFDDPKCLTLIAPCEYVISIHGCKGEDEQIYLGGLDTHLQEHIYSNLKKEDLSVSLQNPAYLGCHVDNICNRGANNTGVQIELSKGLRLSKNRHAFIETLRQSLLSL